MAFTITVEGGAIKIVGNSYPTLENPFDLDVKLKANDIVAIYDSRQKTNLVSTVYTNYSTPSEASAEDLGDALVALFMTARGASSGDASAANQATMITSLQIMDDWDESDRAKTNPIVGSAGVAGGTGTDGATVQRVTLATDIPLPAGTNAIGKLAENSGVDIGDVDVTSQPARDNATDTITASLDTSAIMDDVTSLTPKFVIIGASGSGDNTILAAVVGKKNTSACIFSYMCSVCNCKI